MLKTFLLPWLLIAVSAVTLLADTPAAKPDRYQARMQEFVQEDTKNGVKKGGIVFTGSSSIRLWKLDQAFPTLPVLNRGFGGSISRDLTHYYDQVVAPYAPKILVIYTGTNDLARKMTVDEAYADYTAFMDRVHQDFPKCRILINELKIAGSRMALWPQMKELNARLKAYAEERAWVRFLESGQYLKTVDDQPIDKFFVADRLHLSEEGYVEWNRFMRPILEEEWLAVSEL